MNFNLLEKAIVATIAYYDVLEYPLTGFEVFKYLINPLHIVKSSSIDFDAEVEPLENIDLINILKILEGDNLKSYIDEKNGFYFLQNRRQIAKIRIERQKISDEMWKKSKRIIKWLQIIPYLRMVLMSGSAAMHNAKPESDIDLLVVVKSKRIWTARFFISLLFQIIGKRRHGRKTAGRFCLNHYLTDKSLKINYPSLYNAQTYAHLVLMLEIEENVYNRFQFENRWIGNYLYVYDLQKIGSQLKIKNSRFLGLIRKIKEAVLNTFIGNVLEWFLKLIQKKHIKKHWPENLSGGRIVVDDSQLEFHPESPERRILERFNENMLRLNMAIKEPDSGLIS